MKRRASILAGLTAALFTAAWISIDGATPVLALSECRVGITFRAGDATLSHRDKQTIKQAILPNRRPNQSAVVVVAFVGRGEDGEGISLTRVRAVEAELRQQGVPQDAITVGMTSSWTGSSSNTVMLDPCWDDPRWRIERPRTAVTDEIITTRLGENVMRLPRRWHSDALLQAQQDARVERTVLQLSMTWPRMEDNASVAMDVCRRGGTRSCRIDIVVAGHLPTPSEVTTTHPMATLQDQRYGLKFSLPPIESSGVSQSTARPQKAYLLFSGTPQAAEGINGWCIYRPETMPRGWQIGRDPIDPLTRSAFTTCVARFQWRHMHVQIDMSPRLLGELSSIRANVEQFLLSSLQNGDL